MGQRITFQNAVSAAAADGTIADLKQGDIGGVTLYLEGATFTGTVVFEVRSADDTTWIPIVGRSVADWTTLASTVTNPTTAGYIVNVRGWHYFRARITRTVGSISVWGTLTNGQYSNG